MGAAAAAVVVVEVVVVAVMILEVEGAALRLESDFHLRRRVMCNVWRVTCDV